MTWSRVNTTTGSVTAVSSGGSYSMTFPAATAGNLLLFCVWMDVTNVSISSVPSGWTSANSGTGMNLIAKVAAGGETSVSAPSFSGACNAVGEVLEYSGNWPSDLVFTQGNGGASSTVVPKGSNALIIATGNSIGSGLSAPAWSSTPTGVTAVNTATSTSTHIAALAEEQGFTGSSGVSTTFSVTGTSTSTTTISTAFASATEPYLVSSGSITTAATSSVTPAFATPTHANSLLICRVAALNNSVSITTPAGWTLAQPGPTGTYNTAIFWKMALGGDLAPTILATGATYMAADLSDWSGLSTASPVDHGAASSTATLTNPAADATSAELAVVSMVVQGSKSATLTTSETWSPSGGFVLANHGDLTTKSTSHSWFSTYVTTSNSSADLDAVTLTLSTGLVSLIQGAICSFKNAAPVGINHAQSANASVSTTALLGSFLFGKVAASTVAAATAVSRLLSLHRTAAGTVTTAPLTSRGLTLHRTVSGAVATSAGLVRSISKTFTAAVLSASSVVAARSYIRALLATVTTTPTVARQVTRNLLALASVLTSGSVPRTASYLRSVATTASSAAVVARLLSLHRTLSGSVSTAPSLTRGVVKRSVASVATSSSVLAARSYLRSVVTSITSSGAVTRTVARLRTLTASTGTSGSVATQKSLLRTVATTVAATPAVARRVAKTLTSSVTSSSTLLQAFKVRLLRAVASVTTSPSKVVSIGKAVASSVATAASSSRLLALRRTLTSSVTETPLVQRGVSKKFVATVSTSAAVVAARSYLRTLLAGVTTTGGAARLLALTRSLTASVAPTGSISKSIAKTMSVSVSLAASAAAQFQSFIHNNYQVLAAAAVQIDPTIKRLVAKSLAAAVNMRGVLGSLINGLLTRRRVRGAAAEVYPSLPASAQTAISPPAIMETAMRSTSESGLFSTDD